MIVTCESCKSRYKLDDAKITGRGAKITCPKCKNVFVVYARDPNEVSRPAGTPPVAPRDPTADAVKPAERKDGPGRVVAGPSAPPQSEEAWDDEPTRVGENLPGDGAHEVVRPKPPASIAPPAAPPAAPVAAPAVTKPAAERAPGEAAARAATLDFKSVGVTTWKVKVKIGLVYDFSDIKTLRKYIQDGRVTPSDVVSWDGKQWRAIGDIPDLDVFFVETWEMLAARKEAAPASDTLAPTPPIAPPNADLQKALEESVAATPKNGGEPSQFKDPFAEMRRQQKDKADLKRTAPVPVPPAKPEATQSRSLLPLVLVLLVVGGLGAFWWSQQQQVPAPTAGSGPVPARPAPGTAGGEDDIRERINAELENTLKSQPKPGATAGAETTAADELTPVNAPRPGTPTEELTPRRPDGVPPGATPRPPRGGGTSTPSIQQADQSAADHEAVGDDAAKGGDWSTAVMAYKKAVSLDARSARLQSKLGRAQLESGDRGAAQVTLQRAAQMGAKDAHKYLGRLLEAEGDIAGAVASYQQYLKSGPSDAATIEETIRKLSGG